MAKKDSNSDQGDNSSYEQRKKLLEDIRDIEESSSKNFNEFFKMSKNYLKILSSNRSLNRDIAGFQDQIKSGMEDGRKLSADELGLLQKKVAEYQKTVSLSSAQLKNLSKTKIVLSTLTNEAANFANNLNVYDFLMESDKAIRTLNRDLGISGSLAATVRDNMQSAAFEAAQFGVSISDLTEIQNGFTEATGKLIPLTKDALLNISKIGASTGIASSEAAGLAASFDSIGLSSKATANFVEETLNSSEQMGISGVKAVKTISSNMDKMNKYNFQGGVKSFKEMVQNSLKLKQNLLGVFESADRFRTLEGAIEASAELQTLGGNMAKADAFQLGFLSRNDPQKFAEEIHKLTEGIYTFNKATGQFQASAVDLDRLRRVAEITGQDFGELSVEAKKASQVQFIGSKTIGLSKSDRELVAQLAEFDETSKTFKVNISGNAVDIQNIGKAQLEVLKNQQTSLDQRAKDSQTFDDQFKNTVMQLKSALLPVLNLINKLLSGIDNTFGSNSLGGVATKLALLGGSIGIFQAISNNLGSIMKSIVSAPFKGLAGGAGSAASSAGGSIASKAAESAGKGAGALGEGLGKIPSASNLAGKARSIAAIGIAAVGLGLGVLAASKGVALIGDSFAKLKPDQLAAVNKSLMTLGVIFTSLAIVGSLAGTGLLAAGAGIGLIGLGIGAASAGVSMLVSSFSKLSDPSLGSNTLALAGSITALAASSALLINPASLAGLATFGVVVGGLSSVDFTGMQSAFTAASNFLSSDSKNLDELKATLKLLNETDTSMFSKMEKLFSQPLEVEFKKNQSVDVVINNTINLDKSVLLRELSIGKTGIIEIANLRKGV